MACTICYHEVKAFDELDKAILPIAKTLVKKENLEGLGWLMILRTSCHEHDWSNIPYQAWVLKQICEESKIVITPLLWAVDRFAKKHVIDLSKFRK